ncbi:hypothetical protein SAMN04244579_02424 [Azotobacter beijerinckii]|uniref:Uncharacterized protein n=1 Tax=Azotobacter beijerinckii TaxID=170623 RepID=A0A1H6UN98_9GAMM|nr:hypothetical protein [Azotobacter beijerinckii]SEI91227.1 hypothetical protein SAMN04244579_02424 [Azotobacter beijerinckii]
MSTFAVFGMTEHYAREEAIKNTPTVILKVQLTESQWLEAVERRIEKTMSGTRSVQLSHMFDAPQFAEQYIELLRKAGKARDLKIRAKVKVDQPATSKAKQKAPTTAWKDVA